MTEKPSPRLIWQSGDYRIVELWIRNDLFHPDEPDETGPEWIQTITVEVAFASALGEPSWRETEDAELPNVALCDLLDHVGLIEAQE